MSNLAVRFGEADLTTCDREPIHIPGSIQPHGVLLVVERENLIIEQMAGDSRSLLGIDPPGVIGHALSAILDPATSDFLRIQLSSATVMVAPIVRLGVHSYGGTAPLDLTLHAMDRTALVELEAARGPTIGTGDPIVQLKTLVAAIQHSANLEETCAAAAKVMRAMTGFDRAMVYRFLPDDSGVVTAEDANAGLESFLGLHYPASDIPRQARELYRRNWLRVIPTIDYVAAPLLPQSGLRDQPIDMSNCGLRSVSPIHLEYLRNMGVCASLSASIVFQNRLWGMLVLHHYSPRYVPADLRVAYETFAQILSLQIETKVQAETAALKNRAQRVLDELVARLGEATDVDDTLASRDLPGYLGATGAVIYFEGRLHRIGEVPGPDAIAALVEWLNGINVPLFQSDMLSAQYPPAAEFAAIGSGLLAIGVSRTPRDYVLWFRPEIGRTVRWAGDPSKPAKVDRHGARLTPRGSFAEWREITRLHSEPWAETDIETAQSLRVVFLESALKSLDLARQERTIEETRAMAEELEKRVAQRTEQLRTLAGDLEAAEDRERRQLALDLHDDLGQTLAAARIRLANLCNDDRDEVRATATVVAELIDRADHSIRSLAAQLAPDALRESGLVAALHWLGEEIERTFKLRISVFDDAQPKPLAHESGMILYRAVRELLINVAKHAQTDSAIVETVRQGENIVITVSDGGIGYDAADRPEGTNPGLGLISIRERLSLIGGSADFRSATGSGTISVLRAPLMRAEPTRRPSNK
jgi:light-regulated signal transduction histidine kinase (bacteriophytochrome)